MGPFTKIRMPEEKQALRRIRDSLDCLERKDRFILLGIYLFDDSIEELCETFKIRKSKVYASLKTSKKILAQSNG